MPEPTGGCKCNPRTDERATGYLWRCPHGFLWLCYGEGQNAWTTITPAQYKAINNGMEPRLALQKA